MSCCADGTIFGGPFWEFALAVALILAGAALVFCGSNLCWTRFLKDPRDAGTPRAAFPYSERRDGS